MPFEVYLHLLVIGSRLYGDQNIAVHRTHDDASLLANWCACAL